MKKIAVIITSFFFSIVAYSQYTPKQWVLGQGSGGGILAANNTILFTDTGTFVQVLPGVYNGMISINAAITDGNKPLLFYTNGSNIYNWQHNIVQDGDSLNPCPYSLLGWNNPNGLYGLPQMAVFVPDPSDTNRFYLFHGSGEIFYNQYPGLGGTYVPNKVYYTLIDKTLDNGNGGVISKNNLIGNDTIGCSLLAVKHGNGRDWWIIARHNHRPRFYTWLVTPAGVSGPFMQQKGPIAYAGFYNFKFSALTNKLVGMRAWRTLDSMYVDLYDFDRCTGNIGFSEILPISYNQIYVNPGGCEISPNGRYLYTGTMLELRQFDLLAPNLAASNTLIDDMPFDTSQACGCPYGQMQLGPDGRIYIGHNFGSDLHANVINSPDSAGLACNAVRYQVTFPAYHLWDLPNIPLYELDQLYGSPCDSLSAGINEGMQQAVLQVYPNPAGNHINIKCTGCYFGNYGQVEIYNVTGEMVSSKTLTNIETTMNISFLNSGMYVIKVKTVNKVFIQKLNILR